MNRREAVQQITVLLGGTILGANVFISCRSNDSKSFAFTEQDVALLNEIADTILPPTKTPGAKAAKCGEFMTVMVNDCYNEKDQKIFQDGLKEIQELSKKEYNNSFTAIKPEQRFAILSKLDNEQKEVMKKRKDDNEAKPYFRLIKELTLLGYFTSEIGCTQARRYIETPGRYESCTAYKKGDRAWA